MPSPRSPRRPRGRAWAAAALVLGLLGGVAATGGPGTAASADEAEADPSPAPATELLIAPAEPVLLESDESYTFTAQIDNPAQTPFTAGALRLDLATQGVENEAELSEPFPARSETIAENDVNATGAETAQTVTLTVRRDELPLVGSAPGVYRLQATFTPERSDRRQAITPLTAETTVVWKGVGEARTQLTAVVPIVLPTDVRSMPSKKQLDAAAPKLDALLTAATEARATLAIDPRVIAGIRAYGDDAPLQARRFLERLESSPLSSFLLQFADADPAAQAGLGYTELLQPVGLDYLTRGGAFTSENPGDDADEVEPPTLDELLDWPQQTRPTAWPADGQADRPTLDLLQASGISDYILDSSNVTHSGGPRAALGGQNALIADAELDAAIATAIESDSDAKRQAAFAEATTLLALAAKSGSTGRVLALDRGAIADAENPAAMLERLRDYNWIAPTSAADQQTGTATLRASSTLEERRELLRAAAKREPEVDAVGAVLEHPEDLTAYQRIRLLDLFATHYAPADAAAGFAQAAETYAKRDTELKRGVRAISTEHTQLVGTSTRVPVQLRNSLPFDAIVDVRADPESAALTVTKRGFPRVVVPADGNARVLVPVLSRVSSGESALRIEVTNNAGNHTAYTGSIPLTISSGIETAALWTLGVAAALLLVFGTLRSIRHRLETRRDPAA